jgi:competence ComEA-like helix-hairpin-helix protein
MPYLEFFMLPKKLALIQLIILAPLPLLACEGQPQPLLPSALPLTPTVSLATPTAQIRTQEAILARLAALESLSSSQATSLARIANAEQIVNPELARSLWATALAPSPTLGPENITATAIRDNIDKYSISYWQTVIAENNIPTQTPAPDRLPAKKLDINIASIEELDTLPGIGLVKAQAIRAYIINVGPIAFLDELINVNGIGVVTIKDIADCRCVIQELRP